MQYNVSAIVLGVCVCAAKAKTFGPVGSCHGAPWNEFVPRDLRVKNAGIFKDFVS